jgi:hypothetical protein
VCGRSKQYGIIHSVIKQYNPDLNYNFVTRGAVCHRLRQLESGSLWLQFVSFSEGSPSNEPSLLTDAVTTTNETSDEFVESNTNSTNTSTSMSTTADCETLCDEQENDIRTVSYGGRSKGDTKRAQDEFQRKKMTAITKAATRLVDERCKSKAEGKSLPNGTCKRIIAKIEKEAQLPLDTIKQKTILSRVDSHNLTGIAPQKVSPLEGIEPLLVDYCLKLSNIGQPLTKGQLISLANR